MTEHDWPALVVGALATTYVTCCLVYLDGPWEVFLRVRMFMETRSPRLLGKLWGCPWCTAFWVALVVAAALAGVADWDWQSGGLIALAWSAVAGLLLEQGPEDRDGALDE